MRKEPRLGLLMFAALAGLAAAGCGATDAYIFKPDEFDRDAKTFNKELTDREDVTVCYNGLVTTDKRVEEMADAECRRFGRVAVVAGETFEQCPLLTPVEARFACVKR